MLQMGCSTRLGRNASLYTKLVPMQFIACIACAWAHFCLAKPNHACNVWSLRLPTLAMHSLIIKESWETHQMWIQAFLTKLLHLKLCKNSSRESGNEWGEGANHAYVCMGAKSCWMYFVFPLIHTTYMLGKQYNVCNTTHEHDFHKDKAPR